MPHTSFTLFLTGVDVLSDESADALFAAGCDDATFGACHGAQYARFDREASCFDTAVSSAIRNVTRALPGLAIVRVERSDPTRPVKYSNI